MGGRILPWLGPLVLAFWPLAGSGQAAAPGADPSFEARVAQARESGYWVVREGDTMYRISRFFAADDNDARRLAAELESQNPNAFVLNDPGRLRPGARIRIPDRYLAVGTARTPAASRAGQLTPLDVTINGSKGGTWLFAEIDGSLHAPREALEEWRIQPGSDTPSVDVKGQPYVALSAIPGFKSKIDAASQSIELYFSPQAFSALRLTTELGKRPPVSEVLPAAFLNYDVNFAGQRLKEAPSVRDLGMLWEVGLSNKWGVLTSSQAVRNLTYDKSLGVASGGLRLETTFTHDFPDSNRTLRLGDTTTRAGMWGRNVYYGGIRYGTNFALTPGIVTQPLPTLQGVSAAPSTVELYVNDVLRQTSSVPTGPFAIDNFPVLTSGGEARIVVRDLLGRETVIMQQFITTTQLLAAGLDDFSFEAGRVRLNMGIESNDYGPGFVSGFWRRGVSNQVTLEGRADATADLKVVGAGAAFELPYQVLGTAAIVGSHHARLGGGSKWLLGIDRQNPHSSLTLQAYGSSIDYRELGQEVDVKPYKLQLAGRWTYYTDNRGSLGVGYAYISRYGESRIETVSANYSIPLGQGSNLTFTASHAIAGATGTSAGLTFVMPLDNGRMLTANANTNRDKTDFYASASQNPTADSPYGWRTLAGRQQQAARFEAGGYYMGRFGNQSAEVSVSPKQEALRLTSSGGLVLADSHFFATRRVDQSFAVAEVKDYANIGVGIGGNVLTRTDKQGIALIPQLWPYQVNSVRLDPNELPMSAEIESIEQSVVPAWRSAVKINFPVRAGRGALLRIVFDDGQPAPPSAIVRIEGDKEEFYVARRGEAYVTGLLPGSRVVLTWNGKSCALDVKLPPAERDEVLRIGPIQCKGVAR